MNWEELYRAGRTPWDLGEPHPELVRRLDDELAPEGPKCRALVPGCGRGHDALALARAGWGVIAVDVVDVTDGDLDRALRAHGGRFLREDALAFESSSEFDLLWDHTFFCAIEPVRRREWSAMVRRVVAVGGRVCGISFPEGKALEEGGPPWGMSAGELSGLLEGFDLAESVTPRTGVERRRGRESWYVFVRRA